MNKGDFVNSHSTFMGGAFSKRKGTYTTPPEDIKAATERRERMDKIEDKRLDEELEDWKYEPE